jgi:di/tricarboxylate transporter
MGMSNDRNCRAHTTHLLGGMMTLVGTAPNLVVNGELVRHGFEGFHFFSITPFGLPLRRRR